MNEKEPKPNLQPTRTQFAWWRIKYSVGAAALLGILALGATLYLVAASLLFHHRH